MEGGDLFAGQELHPQRPTPCTLFSSKPIVDTSRRFPRPYRRALLQTGKGGPLKKGWPLETLCGVLGMHRHPSVCTHRGQEPKQVANRRLPSGSPHPPSRVDYQNLRKSIYTPNLLHPTLGLGIGQGLVRTPSPSPLPFHGLLN